MLAAELREYRISQGYTKKLLGLVLGVTGAAVGQWESGKYPIPKTIAYLIEVLKTTARLHMEIVPLAIPDGLCQCGCGRATLINHRMQTAKGWVKGEFRAFVSGHNIKVERRK